MSLVGVPQGDFHPINVGRGAVTHSFDQLEQTGWYATLALAD